MPSFKIITDTSKPEPSRFGLGRGTGSLYVFIPCFKPCLIIGKDYLAGREGEHMDGHDIDWLPVGTRIEITT